MKTNILLLLLAFAALSDTALAASRTVTFTVQNMTCAVCPITVKKALSQVLGVTLVSVDYASKTATVKFDDTAATVDKLTDATKAAGYPSTVKEKQ